MRIFVTGATGYVGNAVAENLARRGHRVLGLTRSKEKGRSLEAREIVPVMGEMKETSAWAEAARSCEVLVHCAADYATDYEGLDRLTVSTFLDWVQAGGRPRSVVYTSGVWLYGDTGGAAVDETMAFETAHMIPWRAEHEKRVLAASGVVIRPGCVYGGRGGLTGLWFGPAEKDGAVAVAGEGANRWTMVHVEDLAELYARAIERGVRGELFNATDRSRFTVLENATAAARAVPKAAGKVKKLSTAEAEKAYGNMLKGLVLDQHVDSSKAARLLGWQPRFGGFAEDAPRYYAAWRENRS